MPVTADKSFSTLKPVKRACTFAAYVPKKGPCISRSCCRKAELIEFVYCFIRGGCKLFVSASSCLPFRMWTPQNQIERFDSAKRAEPSSLELCRGAKTCFEKERFDSAKRAVENLFSDGRGAKTCLEKDRIGLIMV